MHRDLSAHNIIWYKPPGESSRGYGKLCDFEYAKREDDDSYHMVRSVRKQAAFIRDLLYADPSQGFQFLCGLGDQNTGLPQHTYVS